ncbi:MAG: hypothetical protein ACRCT2_15065 [Plesiomonas shigelloides]
MISIRIDISATVKGAHLFGDLNVEFVDAANKLLDLRGYLISKSGTGFECYVTKSFPDATPIDPLAYVEDRLEMTKSWMLNGNYTDLFRMERLIIDIDGNRFQYKARYSIFPDFEWVVV